MSKTVLFLWLVGYGLISASIGGIAYASTRRSSHEIEYVPKCLDFVPDRKHTKVAEL